MRFAEDINDAQFMIRAYGPGQVTVNKDVLTQSLVISPEHLIRDWPPQSLAELTQDHLDAALTHKPEILIIGTGALMRFPHPSLIAKIQAQGIGVEVMDTAAACRTYNILVSEQRRVTAALIMT